MSPFDPATIPASAPAHTYATYDQGAGVSIANNATAPLKWAIDTLPPGQTALLSLTSDTLPTIVTTGTYAISTTVTPDDLTVGGGFNVFLQATVGTKDIGVGGNSSWPNASLQPTASVGLVFYLPAGTVVQVQVQNRDGVAARAFFNTAIVQRIG